MISIDIDIMIIFYKVFRLYYSYLSNFFENKYELYLLNHGFDPYMRELYFGENYSIMTYPLDKIIKMLTTGKIEKIEVTSDEYTDMMYSDEAFDFILQSYFLRQFMSKDMVVIPIDSIKDYISIISDQESNNDHYVMYDNFGHIIDRYVGVLES
jgi:hypothetical protein